MRKTHYWAIICLLISFAVKGAAEHKIPLKFADPLTNNMVVQQNKPFKVWGTASPGQDVKITADWLTNPIIVQADEKGDFLGLIEVPEAQKGNYAKHTLSIASEDSTVTLQNILIGDVWFCSGQSNMQFGMDEVINAKEEIAQATYPHIRLFSAELNFSNTPVDTIAGQWVACSPKTVEKFSAVGYYFGKKLHETLDIPIGIIFTGIGASAAQAYVPQQVLAADPLLDSVYLQPYLQSERSKEVIDGGFTFEKVTRPFLLYNAMIHPLANLSIKGICWYQGESNRHERESYTQLMYAMIKSWRKHFEQGTLPFYYVQIAPFFYDIEDPTLADYAFFREAQENISALNNTEMVVTMDVGEAKDLHPKNKKPIGTRLAKTALNRTYGYLNVAYQGPHFQSARFEGDTVIISFDPETVKSGLQTNDHQEPKYFFLAGKDKVFHVGNAKIVGKKIYVTSPKVSRPVAVRYAFTNYPVTNLENKEGLPAVPFRSDNWAENRQKQ